MLWSKKPISQNGTSTKKRCSQFVFLFTATFYLIFFFYKKKLNSPKNINKTLKLKGTQCFVHLNRQQHYLKKIIPVPVQEAIFFSRVLCKYKAIVGMGAMEGTVLYRRAASLLGWKSSLSQLFKLKVSQIFFWERFI